MGNNYQVGCITADVFGKSRYIDILSKNKDKKRNETFFSIEPMDKQGRYGFKDSCYGYTEITEQIKTMFSKFVTREPECCGFSFIEWEDCWNVVLENDFLRASDLPFRMEKDEFEKFRKTIEK